MRPVPSRWVLGLVLGLSAVGAGGGLRAGEPPSDRMLQKHGLKRSGPLFVLEAESAALEKAEEIRGLSHDLNAAVARQRSTLSEKEYQETIKELTAELNQLKAQSNVATQTLNQLPRFRTRRGTYYANNNVTEEAAELGYYRSQLQMEINQRDAFLKQLKSKPFDPRDRLKADAEVHNREEALRQGAGELRKLVDDVRAKYAEVAKDAQVKKWLQTPEGSANVKPRLGPSRAFVLEEKMLERVERQTSSGEPFAASPKASRKGRHTTKARRPSASGDAANPF